MPPDSLPIFYDPRQNAFTPESASPSAHKPAEVMASWQRLGIPLDIRVMTSEQMRRRDALVFSGCRRLGLPVAWNLAGGYQQPLRKVLDLHDATLLACADAFGDSEPGPKPF